jgi:hypothetical protein
METRRSQAAVRVFAEVFAEFAFLFGDPVPREKLPALEGPGYLATMAFGGPILGGVTLGLPERLALEIAANTLGLDPSDLKVKSSAQDAVREVASVLGGHLASSFAGTSSDVALYPPRLVPLEESVWERLCDDSSTLCFAVNGCPVLFRVEFRREEASA